MQCAGFSWTCPSPLCLRWQGRELPRVWVLLCLLPMLLMSVMSQAPHRHELQVFAQALHAGGPQNAATAGLLGSNCRALNGSNGSAHWGAALGVMEAQTALTHAVLTPVLTAGNVLQDNCLLCHWASVTGALLAVALAQVLPSLRVLARPISTSFHFFFVFLALRSRAPPR